jgi:ribose/xylose/arabinose/galactoside ABC-type transport system permease subunit
MEVSGARRRGWWDRRRRGSAVATGGAVAAGAAVGMVNLIARIVWIVATLVAIVIVVGIAFVVLEANTSNSIVSAVHDAAKFLVGPFDGLFNMKDHKLEVGVNWGIAALVYLFVGRLVARLLAR